MSENWVWGGVNSKGLRFVGGVNVRRLQLCES